MSAPLTPPPSADLTPAEGISSSGKSVIASIVIFVFIATVSVGLRLICRNLKSLRLGFDDWLIVAALLLYYGDMAGALVGMIAGGQGFHIWRLPMTRLVALYKSLFASEIVYIFTITLARVSINVLFVRIFDLPKYKKAAYVNIAFNLCWLIFGFFAQFFRCHPVNAAWDITITTGKCANFEAIELVLPIWGVLCDFTTWVLPLPLVWRLQVSNAQRLGLSLIFAIGLIVIAMGIVRAVTISNANYADFTYGFTAATVVLVAEPSLAILCACGPLFRPAWERARQFSFVQNTSSKIFSQNTKQYNELSGRNWELQDHAHLKKSDNVSSASTSRLQANDNDVIIRRDVFVEEDNRSDAQYLGRTARASEV